MKLKKLSIRSAILFFAFGIWQIGAQIQPGLYVLDVDNTRHELKISYDYLIHSVYEMSPADFKETHGGFYQVKDGVLYVDLEFNSNYESDGVKKLTIPFSQQDDELIFKTDPQLTFVRMESTEQDLDGAWLFATRGPDTGQERRGEENPRKTLKFLTDNRFQWIAYQTETMKFSGTGGGSYTAEDGVYTENIEYFSRDNSRVGASLEFNYEIKGDDWHHTGKNSKGEPMYEIWSRRPSKNK
jgi:hypothetical protein